MTISAHTLYDIVVAIVTTVGIAAALSLAFMAAAALYQRSEARVANTRRGGPVTTAHPTQLDAGRDLVLR